MMITLAMSSVFSVYRNEWSKNNRSTLPLPPLKLPYVSRKKKAFEFLARVICRFVRRTYQHRATAHFTPPPQTAVQGHPVKTLFGDFPSLYTHGIVYDWFGGFFFSTLFFFFPSSLAFLINSFPSLHGPNRTHPHCS